jgi:hypothetical protein
MGIRMRLPCVVWLCVIFAVLSALRIASLYALSLHMFYERVDEGGVGSRMSTGRGLSRSRLQTVSASLSALSGDGLFTFRTLLQLTVTCTVLVVMRHQFAEVLDSCGLSWLSPLLSEHYLPPSGCSRDFSDLPALSDEHGHGADVGSLSSGSTQSDLTEDKVDAGLADCVPRTPFPPDWLVFDKTKGLVPLSTM